MTMELRHDREQPNKPFDEREGRYRRLLEAVDQGVWSVDAVGVIDYINPRGAEILGIASAEVLGRSPSMFVFPGDAADTAQRLDRCREGYREQGEFRLRCNDGVERWIQFASTPLSDALSGYRGSVTHFADISEGRKVMLEAQQAGREFHDLYHNAPCGYHSLDAAGTVVQINDTELGWLGYARDEVEGKMQFSDLMPAHYSDRFAQNFALLKERDWLRDNEYEMRRKDGTTFPVLIGATAVKDADGQFIRSRASVFDVSKEKWAEQELRRYADELRAASRRLVEVQEAERRALASQLHDLVGQKLTALSINLNIVKAQLAPSTTAQVNGRLDDSLTLLDETIESIRDVMAELRPAVLDDYGLIPVLRWYAEQFTKRTGVETAVVEREPIRRLPPVVEEALFRIAQEALANVAKHARARKATVALTVESQVTCLTIADDGEGFDPTISHQPARDRGWGLMIMRERAAAVNAELRVESAPGRGTQVIVTLKGATP
ncbi:MAG: PAS domain S-box protein [Burkholderiales bacterium]|nr:PAS domain S-box protein [Burkholderiales bacterium]